MKIIKTILLLEAGGCLAAGLAIHQFQPAQTELSLYASFAACFAAFCFCQAGRGQ
jgi:hypothetical protein